MRDTAKTINYSFSLLAILLLYLFVPKNKIREATIIFLFKQSIAWLFGLIVAEKKLIQYPVRFFSYSTRASFAFEYIVYPAICVLFNLTYPKNLYKGILHNAYITSGITALEVVLSKFTNVIEYRKWNWYWTWVSIFIFNCLSRLFYCWFFSQKKDASSDKPLDNLI